MENSKLITKALGYIYQDYRNSALTVEDVASHAGFSTNYFNRVFFAHTGFNVMEYLRFVRLTHAASLLAYSDRDVLEIALECGYESHESFTRAFKKHYCVSPSEYRKKSKDKDFCRGESCNVTVAQRILRDHPQIKFANPDEVRDDLLKKDAVRYGYTAVKFKISGGAAVYLGDDFRRGFVWFTEGDENFDLDGTIICDDYRLIAEYLKTFKSERCHLALNTLDEDAVIKEKLKEYGVIVESTDCTLENAYTGEPYDLIAPEGILVRELHYEDIPILRSYHDRGGRILLSWVKHLEKSFYQRDVLKTTEIASFVFGIFKNGELIGYSCGGLQSANGFTVNICTQTVVDDEHRTDELFKYTFMFMTNAALEKGALPVDIVLTPGSVAMQQYGSFSSRDFGYRLANRRVVICYKV